MQHSAFIITEQIAFYIYIYKQNILFEAGIYGACLLK